MGRHYSVDFNKTNTASTTVPMGQLTVSTSTRARIWEIICGSDAVADNAVKYQAQKASARGTSSTSVTPTALDPADPAALCTFDTAWSGNPTLTASAFLLTIGM